MPRGKGIYQDEPRDKLPDAVEQVELEENKKRGETELDGESEPHRIHSDLAQEPPD